MVFWRENIHFLTFDTLIHPSRHLEFVKCNLRKILMSKNFKLKNDSQFMKATNNLHIKTI